MFNSLQNTPNAPFSHPLFCNIEKNEHSSGPSDDALLLYYLEAYRAAGNEVRVGDVTYPWRNISYAFNNPRRTEQDYQRAWLYFKKQCREVLLILDSPGFTWDFEYYLPVAVEENWDEFALHHPELLKWRYQPFPLFFNALRVLRYTPDTKDYNELFIYSYNVQ